ncbi:AMP-binding protein [Streptomyces ureilyticus]|uniref:AMP-binding protein n=1 Tax=Streptomyces ureilyticus TaxID=1775131 RepID=A0ABX0DWS4_9ACTN|nr:AMP-binding protein [Streptomyces ureilyticus]NGO46378.1 AMP-binding protein [Streptomyces ureilyticus]
MHWETIRKDTAPVVPPCLTDYDRACSAFTWSQARSALAGLPDGGLNMAHEAVDRHVASDHADKVALRCVARDDSVSTVTYAELARRTARFANVLRSLGLGHGDRVFTLLGRCPELYTAVLGTLRTPACSARSSPPSARTRWSSGCVSATRRSWSPPRPFTGARSPSRASVPGLKHVLIVGPGAAELPGTASFDNLMSAAPDTFTIPPTSPDDMALLHFTSGTTGTPKGAVHVHEAVVAHHATAAYALDLHPEDVYWCTADPGWVTGMSYRIIAPLVPGRVRDRRRLVGPVPRVPA